MKVHHSKPSEPDQPGRKNLPVRNHYDAVRLKASQKNRVRCRLSASLAGEHSAEAPLRSASPATHASIARGRLAYRAASPPQQVRTLRLIRR